MDLTTPAGTQHLTVDDASLVTRIQRITNRSSIEFRAAHAELRCVALEAERRRVLSGRLFPPLSWRGVIWLRS